MKPVLVAARGLSKTFGQGATATPVLHDIDLEVRAGELTLIMGPSGSGKTTLVSLLAGLLAPSAGGVTLCGTPLDGLPQAKLAALRRAHLGFVFQTPNLFAALTALDNVAEILALAGRPLGPARQRATEALTRVGLGQRLHHRPDQLSGGQKQRVAIARALAPEPALVIADEPTAALDKGTGRAVLAHLRRHVAARSGVLVVTHDPRWEEFADRVVELEDGRVGGDRPGGFDPARPEELAA
jgi:putative ABC transport system ATP-binding protein